MKQTTFASLNFDAMRPKHGRDWHIAAERGKVKAMDDQELRDLHEQIEHLKASRRWSTLSGS